MKDAAFIEVIERLRPSADQKVMDLVAEAGIDVAPWTYKEDGSPVEKPRANPNYCYEWAFGGEEEPIALCVWHEQLTRHEAGVAYVGNQRKRAAELESIVLDRRESTKTKSRAKQQAKRCDGLDRRVQWAWRRALPIRLILLVGDRADDLGHDSSKVSHRHLDSEKWWVRDYDLATGDFTLLRGSRETPVEAVLSESEVVNERYVDQFSITEPPERQERLVGTYLRSTDVRRRVLARASGNCELCGRQGFRTASDQIYLETHHVESLADGGCDAEWNVVGLCPDDHRRAHFADDAATIKQRLLDFLAPYSPSASGS